MMRPSEYKPLPLQLMRTTFYCSSLISTVVRLSLLRGVVASVRTSLDRAIRQVAHQDAAEASNLTISLVGAQA